MDIAIIGCGYGGAVLLDNLLTRFDGALNIHVYDRDGHMGEGYAYQPDAATNLLNRPSDLMYFRRRGDFSEYWNGGGLYASRSAFGMFVREKLAEQIIQATLPPVFLHEEATSVTRQGPRFEVRTGRSLRTFDTVVLATGNEPPEDVYDLSGSKGYIGDPYPTDRLENLPDDNVAILGSRLSAIDAALTLLNSKNERRVALFTRRSGLPHACEPYCQARLLTVDERTLSYRMRPGPTSLASLVNVIDGELQAHDIPMTVSRLLTAEDWQDDEPLKQKLYGVLSAMNTLVPLMWSLLSRGQQGRFRRGWSSAWNAARVPVPPAKLNEVRRHISNGRLAVHKGLSAVAPSKDGFQLTSNGQVHTSTCLVNATGPAGRLSSVLYRQLIADQLASEHPSGGIRVDLADCRVVSSRPGSLYALGHPTCGTFFSVSNIDVIQMQSSKIVSAVERLLKERAAPREVEPWQAHSVQQGMTNLPNAALGG